MNPSPSAPEAQTLPECDRAFLAILGHLDDEEYERAMAAATTFLEKEPKSPYRPYASYFKLFAEAYREWQCTYHYTQIRSYFMLAHYLLLREQERAFPGGLPAAHATLIEAFRHLSQMLSSYTWCENSLITNDSFALTRRAVACCAEEEEGLRILEDYVSELAVLRRMADWLTEYFKENRLLHEGFAACGRAYSAMFLRSANLNEEYERNMQVAMERHAELEKISPELSSELNAHIQHIRAHYLRIHSGEVPVTYLRITSGKLVLSMSAACNETVARKVIDDPAAWEAIRAEFLRRGIVARDFRNAKLNDIFETSFGRDNLRELALDLDSPTGITFLNDRDYSFDLHISLSAFGVCTLYFTLDIKQRDEGLSVEEIRTLESFICPQTGQVRIDQTPSALGARAVFESAFPDRLDLAGVVKVLDDLHDWIRQHPEAELKRWSGVQNAFLHVQQAVIEEVKGRVSSTRASIMVSGPFKHDLANKLLAALQSLADDKVTAADDRVRLQRFARQLHEHCCGHVYLTELAREYLETVEDAFRSYSASKKLLPFLDTVGKGEDQAKYVAQRVWHLSTDTGWHAYLNATAIDVVGRDGRLREKRLPFNQLHRHPDAIGLFLEQRESRASFDDWRFAACKEVPQQENLAHIRSHLTDAFFGSEYQAFLYFPDDPQFLVDQYEATVKLMIRIDTALKFYNDLSQMLTLNVRHQLEAMDRHAAEVAQGKLSEKDILQEEESLESDLEAIWRLRSEANTLQNIVCRAGISRYKDHGDLMARIVEKMSIDKVVHLLDEYLKNLDALHKQIQEALSELKARLRAGAEARTQKLLVLVAVASPLLAVLKIIELLFKTDLVRNGAEKIAAHHGPSPAGLESIVTISVVIAAPVVYAWFNWPRGDKSRARKGSL